MPMVRQHIAESSAGSFERVQPVQPCQTDDLGALENRGAVGEQQRWHPTDAAKRIRGWCLFDFAAQTVLETFDEAVASIAQWE
jgi:hypothetical protein